MKKYFVVTAFGKDRPGIVAQLTQVLFEVGGNIEDATMTRLGGEFSIMLVTGLPGKSGDKEVLRKLRPAVKRLGLEVALKPIGPGLARSSEKGAEAARYLISVYGTDRPGIVHQVAKLLADRKVNITDLNTRAIHRDGKPIYVMLLEAQVPGQVDLDDLRTELDRLRTSLDVEITLQDIDAATL